MKICPSVARVAIISEPISVKFQLLGVWSHTPGHFLNLCKYRPSDFSPVFPVSLNMKKKTKQHSSLKSLVIFSQIKSLVIFFQTLAEISSQ